MNDTSTAHAGNEHSAQSAVAHGIRAFFGRLFGRGRRHGAAVAHTVKERAAEIERSLLEKHMQRSPAAHGREGDWALPAQLTDVTYGMLKEFSSRAHPDHPEAGQTLSDRDWGILRTAAKFFADHDGRRISDDEFAELDALLKDTAVPDAVTLQELYMRKMERRSAAERLRTMAQKAQGHASH